MKKRMGSVLLTGVAAATLSTNLISVAVAAETSASANAGDELTEIVVTARRTEENLQDVPISITVFNQQQLENRNIVNSQDLATYVPSLSSNSLFGADNSTFAIRGFVQENGTAPSVGVLFADVIMPRSASNSIPGGDGAGPGAFFDLENVQVLKGPQGTLFGRNTTGGDILLVPKKPTSELSGFVEGGVGNYSDGEFQAVINIPVNDSFRVRAGVVHETREGYLHNTGGIGPKDFDDIDYTSARLSAVIDILPNLENYTIGSFSVTGDNGNVEKLVAADPTGTSLSAAVLFGPNAALQLSKQGSGFYQMQQSLPYAKSHLEQWQVINTTTWKATDHLTVKNIASYAQLRDNLYSAIFGTNWNILAGPGAGQPYLFAASIPFPGGGTANERTVTEELQFQGDALDSHLTWQGGAYLELALPDGIVGSLSPVGATCADNSRDPTVFHCSDAQGYVLGGALAAFGIPIPGGFAPFAVNNLTAASTNYRDFAFYAQSTYKFNDMFKITGGIRWTNDHEEADAIQKTYHYLPYPGVGIFPAGSPAAVAPGCTQGLTDPRAVLPNCEIDYTQNSRAPTWMIDFDYNPLDNLLLYAKYTRGYREGAINPTIPAPLNNVQPEKVDSYEIGEKLSFHGAIAGTVNASAFYNDFRNQQIQLGFDQNPLSPVTVGPAAGPQNAGKSRIYGFELESSLLLFPGFRLDAAYTYLNTRIQEVTLPTLPANSPYIASGNFKVGDPLSLTPKNKASVTPTYTLPLPTSIGSIALSATFTHTDKQLANYSDREVVNNPTIVALSYLQATNLLNLNVNWANVMGKPVDVNLFATNVTKQEYYTFTSGVGTNGFETANVGPPMMFGVRVKLRYN